jgi:hypothetical protein
MDSRFNNSVSLPAVNGRPAPSSGLTLMVDPAKARPQAGDLPASNPAPSAQPATWLEPLLLDIRALSALLSKLTACLGPRRRRGALARRGAHRLKQALAPVGHRIVDCLGLLFAS